MLSKFFPIALALSALLGAHVFLTAQESKLPTLTDVQKLQLQTLAQRIEIAQLKAQIAQREFDAARAEIVQLVTTLQVKGYTLDLQTYVYQPDAKPAAEKAP